MNPRTLLVVLGLSSAAAGGVVAQAVQAPTKADLYAGVANTHWRQVCLNQTFAHVPARDADGGVVMSPDGGAMDGGVVRMITTESHWVVPSVVAGVEPVAARRLAPTTPGVVPQVDALIMGEVAPGFAAEQGLNLAE